MNVVIKVCAALALITRIPQIRRSLMALGPETTAAIADVKAAIVAETNQAEQALIDRFGSDTETALAIRELLAPIKAVIPDETEEEPAPEAPVTDPVPEPGPVEPSDVVSEVPNA